MVTEINPAGPTSAQQRWMQLKYGAFVCFNDNTYTEKEFSKNTDPSIVTVRSEQIRSWGPVFKECGLKYAVLTTRHTSGFCLWPTQMSEFSLRNAGPGASADVVREFVETCLENGVQPGIYYCMWGNEKWNPAEWNESIRAEVEATPTREIILAQLRELAGNYGPQCMFWLDVQYWAPENLSPADSYNAIKELQPETVVLFNQHVQDGTTLYYHPTDAVNGEERMPPEEGHNPIREVDGQSIYLPFESELTTHRSPGKSLGNGLLPDSCWFTYTEGEPYPAEDLAPFAKGVQERGGSNVLFSFAPDETGYFTDRAVEQMRRTIELIRGEDA
jgi:alpha-L-fucosidase